MTLSYHYTMKWKWNCYVHCWNTDKRIFYLKKDNFLAIEQPNIHLLRIDERCYCRTFTISSFICCCIPDSLRLLPSEHAKQTKIIIWFKSYNQASLLHTNSTNKNEKEAIKFHLKSHKNEDQKYSLKTRKAPLTTTTIKVVYEAADENFLNMTAVHREIQLKRHTCIHRERKRYTYCIWAKTISFHFKHRFAKVYLKTVEIPFDIHNAFSTPTHSAPSTCLMLNDMQFNYFKFILDVWNSFCSALARFYGKSSAVLQVSLSVVVDTPVII